MNHNIKSTLAIGLVVAATFFSTSPAQAEIHSKSKDLVVMEPSDLPEQAQTPGNSIFLHSDNAGDTYLMSSSSMALASQSLTLPIRLTSSW